MHIKTVLKRTAAILLAALTVFPLVSCQKIPKSTREEKTAVLTVDEFSVPYEQVRYVVRNYMAGYGDDAFWTEEKAEELSEEILADTYETLRQQYAILSLAKKYGIERTDSAIGELVDSQMTAVIEGYGGEKAYTEALEAAFMTDSVYRFFLTVNAVSEELYYAMLEKGDLMADGDGLTAVIRSDEFVRVKQILIENGADDDPAENRETAEKARARAAAGEDFDALVKEYGEDLYMFNNTDGYYMCRGVWHKAFEDTAFSLGIGEISEVIETDAGYSVLLRCEKEESYISAHLAELGEDYRDAVFSLAIEKTASEMTVSETEAFQQYTLLTMD